MILRQMIREMMKHWERDVARLIRRMLRGIVIVGLLIGVVWVVWQVPPALYAYVPDPKDRASAEALTRTGIIAGLAGLAALGSLRVSTRTYQLTEQGQVTDRYTKAIAQLGDDKLGVRLGGIYALERIAVDSKRDNPTVVQVLSAFVREHGASIETRRPANEQTAHPPTLRKQVKLSADVEAAVTVLGRIPRQRPSRGDLTQANLAGANLVGADLSQAILHGTNLTGANLVGAILIKAEFFGADLSGAQFYKADLSGAMFDDRFDEGAKLIGARLTEARLTDADLTGADLSQAILHGANLTRASLLGANLTEASLVGADLTKAYLSQKDLDGALGDDSTKLPIGLRRPDEWRDAVSQTATGQT